jgi:hypothetical protein
MALTSAHRRMPFSADVETRFRFNGAFIQRSIRLDMDPFSTDGMNPMSGFSQMMIALHKASKTSGWTLRDLRQTARTLMSRAGVPSDITELCLGHVIGGVRGIYDHYEYREEKTEAYAKLAAIIERIVNAPDNAALPAGQRT